MPDQIDRIIDAMTIEQRAGQFLVYGFAGAFPHRDVLESIEKHHVAGFRVTPHGRKFAAYLPPGHPARSRVDRAPERLERVYGSQVGEPRLTVAEYADTLNVLRRRSLECNAGVPVHFEHDFEGNYNADVLDERMAAFPHYMGLACSGDPGLTRQVGYWTGRELKTAGIDLIHGPVLDVNTTPLNPEIETRSFSPLPEVCSAHGLAYMQGLCDGGVAAVAKHFPGRGASDKDAHYDVPVIGESRERMDSVHLAPYRPCIAAGLPAIMLAHSIYPALDPSGTISTLSRRICHDVLRTELGFKGVLISDSFTMAGLIALHDVPEAVVRAILAGIDWVLMKDENALRGEVHAAVAAAIRSGRISEQRVREGLRRGLELKQRFGLLSGTQGIIDQVSMRQVHDDPRLHETAREAARRSLAWVRRSPGWQPLKRDEQVLVCEEAFGLQTEMNNSVAYCGALFRGILAHGVDATFVDYDRAALDQVWPRIQELATASSRIVLAGYTKRGQKCPREVFERFATLGKPLMFVVNSPYPKLVPPAFSDVLCTCATHAHSHRAAADVLCGQLGDVDIGHLGFDPTRTY